MMNNINVSGGSRNNRVIVKSSNTNKSVGWVNNAAWYWAQVAKNYAEQTEQDIDEIVNGMQADGNIVLIKNERCVTIGTKSYVHNQNVASSTWNIQHNLNKRCPKVTIIDTAGTIFYPNVEFIDDNNCRIALIGAMAGKAYCE